MHITNIRAKFIDVHVLHVYELMHMMYMCKHAQTYEDKQHMQNKTRITTCIDIEKYCVWYNAWCTCANTRANNKEGNQTMQNNKQKWQHAQTCTYACVRDNAYVVHGQTRAPINTQRWQTLIAKQKQKGNMHRRINVHVYEIMHMVYVCKHAQTKHKDKQEMQNKHKRATCVYV